jgi:hypothetical protein
MAKLVTGCPRLRRVVCLRKLCYRHSSRCVRSVAPCVAFQHPPTAGTLEPTWCESTTVFAYDVLPDKRQDAAKAALEWIAATTPVSASSVSAGPHKRSRDSSTAPGTPRRAEASAAFAAPVGAASPATPGTVAAGPSP